MILSEFEYCWLFVLYQTNRGQRLIIHSLVPPPWRLGWRFLKLFRSATNSLLEWLRFDTTACTRDFSKLCAYATMNYSLIYASEGMSSHRSWLSWTSMPVIIGNDSTLRLPDYWWIQKCIFLWGYGGPVVVPSWKFQPNLGILVTAASGFQGTSLEYN